MNEEEVFSPEQITAMMFSKLKDIAEAALQIKVHDCVISVSRPTPNCASEEFLTWPDSRKE